MIPATRLRQLDRRHQPVRAPSMRTLRLQDVVQLHPNSQVAILTRWGAHRGEYMFHCHNLRHEDNEMMRSYDNAVRNDTVRLASAAFATAQQYPSGLGVLYDDYKNPLYGNAAAKPTGAWPALSLSYLRTVTSAAVYRIFYPSKGMPQASELCNATVNPWVVFHSAGADPPTTPCP